MKEGYTRQIELGKMLLDIAKYIATIVVVSGVFTQQMKGWVIIYGAILAVSFAGVGYWVIPEEESHE